LCFESGFQRQQASNQDAKKGAFMGKRNRTTKTTVTLTVWFLVLISINSCKSESKKEIAIRAVAEFRSQVDQAQYTDIFARADKDFREGSTETNFIDSMRKIHQKLGKVQRSHLSNSQVAWYLGEGTTVTLKYDTQFTEGKAHEQFVWRIINGRALLAGYYINSDLFD
jgi:hypothetical protein